MLHHLTAFGGAAQDYSAGLVTVPHIADGLLRSNSNVLQLTDNWKALWSFGGGVGHTRLRLSSARARLNGYPNLVPFMASALAGGDPDINDMRDFPIDLYAGENVTLQATNGGAQAFIALLALTRDEPNFNVNVRGLRKVRFTASITSVAYAWSAEGNVTLDDDLEAGMYGVFGMQVWEADLIAARLVFKDQVERPGCVALQTVTTRPASLFMGGMGMWGKFDTITPPFLQIMNVAAAAQTIEGYLLLGKIR